METSDIFTWILLFVVIVLVIGAVCYCLYVYKTKPEAFKFFGNKKKEAMKPATSLSGGDIKEWSEGINKKTKNFLEEKVVEPIKKSNENIKNKLHLPSGEEIKDKLKPENIKKEIENGSVKVGEGISSTISKINNEIIASTQPQNNDTKPNIKPNYNLPSKGDYITFNDLSYLNSYIETSL